MSAAAEEEEEEDQAQRCSTDLKRASADLDGPAKTNLLLVLWVRKGLIIRL